MVTAPETMTVDAMAPEAAAPEAIVVAAWQIAESVPDPELPMLTLADLGILREITLEDQRIIVSLTPTYSGCPAMHEMRRDVHERLSAAGLGRVEVRTQLSPAWSTDWITPEGRRKLAAAGIAPPQAAPVRSAGPIPLTLSPTQLAISCPACGSGNTQRTAGFSGTACKDLFRCRDCAEPFEHIKEI